MGKFRDRRWRLVVAGAALLACTPRFVAASAAAAEPTGAQPPFRLQSLGHGVWAAIATPHGSAGSNAGFIVGSTGVLVVDTFEDPGAARALLAAIRKRTALPVRYVVDTHYHLDHVAGNGVFRDAGAVLLAQRNVRAWERTLNLKFFGAKITAAERRMVQSYVRPSVLYRDGVEVYLGDRRVVIEVLPGHTGGDSVVEVPDADVVFTGDLFWGRALPNLIDADTRAQIASDEALAAAHPRATFVPGHGVVGHAADVRAFAGYLSALRAAVAAARARGLAADALVRAAAPGLRSTYGGWDYFDHFIAANLLQTAAELAGKKSLPQPPPAGSWAAGTP